MRSKKKEGKKKERTEGGWIMSKDEKNACKRKEK